jgi:trigger factor
VYREFSHNLLERAGVSPEEIEKREGEFDEAAKAGATREVRKFFILRKIAEAEGLKAEDEEVEAEVAKMARARKVRATDLFHQLEEEEELPKIRADIEQRKALDFLVQQANIKVVPRERRKAADGAPGAGGEGKEAAPGTEPGQSLPAAAKPDVPEGT